MNLSFNNILLKAKQEIEESKSISVLESIKIKFLGKKGLITSKILTLRSLPKEGRIQLGKKINQVKREIKIAIKEKISILKKEYIKERINKENIDVSLPGRYVGVGNLHPISYVISQVEKFFFSLGFSKQTGLEIEDKYYNFEALNIPEYHPARTSSDTFWFDETRLLRTQTSCIQMRIMKLNKPPIRIISSGKVYRNDYDQTHTPMFHQVEGLVIDNNVSFSNMKEMISNFLYYFFEKKIKVRFRPSYFPFTEPSAEIDILQEDGTWMEILGCGMVHPKILNNAKINKKYYSGFAFGIGIERLAMLYYNVKDLRAFFENDLRFLNQFK